MPNHWLVIPHTFERMPEPWFRELCITCGGRRFSSPHPDNITTWSLKRLMSNTSGLDEQPSVKQPAAPRRNQPVSRPAHPEQ